MNKYPPFLIKYLVLFCLAVLPIKGETKKIPMEESKDADFSDQVGEVHKTASEGILSISDSIDWFLTGDEEKRKNKTRIKLTYISSKVESSEFENDVNFKISLRLPNFQNKLRLTFENEGEEETKATRQQGRLEHSRRKSGTKSSLSLWMKEVMNFRVKLTTGVRLRLPPEVFMKLKFRRLDKIKNWRIGFEPNFYWSSEEGYAEFTSLNFDYDLNHEMMFRFANEQDWHDDTDELRTSHGPSIISRLSPRRVISYNLRANFTNRPTYVIQNYNFSIGYRQNLKDTWFYYDLIPQMDFAKNNDFKMRLGATLKVSMIFGYH